MLNSFFKKYHYTLITFALAGITNLVNAQVEQVIDNKGSHVIVENNTVTTGLVQPNNPVVGDVWFDTTFVPNRAFVWDGVNWIRIVDLTPVVTPLVGDYMLTAADDRSVLTFNRSNGANITLTVPLGLPIGFNVSIYQIGTDAVNIVGAGGVVVSNRLARFRTAGQNAGAGLISTANNVFHLTGDLRL